MIQFNRTAKTARFDPSYLINVDNYIPRHFSITLIIQMCNYYEFVDSEEKND